MIASLDTQIIALQPDLKAGACLSAAMLQKNATFGPFEQNRCDADVIWTDPHTATSRRMP